MRVTTGKARGTPLKAPAGQLTRPTADKVKEALFNIIQFEIADAAVLDLFAGSGQLGIEALSRGASRAVFVDHREDACAVVRENLRRTGLEGQGSVVRADYAAYLNSCRDTFQLILLDPPYSETFLENSIKKLVEIDILQSGGIIGLERPVGKDFPLEFSGYSRSRDYKYGKTLLTFYRKV